jgi:hypothetical protein
MMKPKPITVRVSGASRRSARTNFKPASTPRTAGALQRLPLRHERQHDQERDEEGGRVEVEHVRRAEDGDQEPCERRADQAGEGRAALDHAVALHHQRLVLADELRQHDALRRGVRRHERPEQGDDPEQEREAEEIPPSGGSGSRA